LRDVRGVGVCMACGGAFLASDAAHAVARALDENATAIADVAARHAQRGADVVAAAHCPVCHAAMQRFHVGSVDVDTCMEHGTWYDRGELGAVRDALRAGRAASSSSPPAAVPASKRGRDNASGLELAHAPTHRKIQPNIGVTHAADLGAQHAIDRLTRDEQRQHRRQNSWYNRHTMRQDADNAVNDLARGNVAGAAFDVLDILFRSGGGW
jgi:Zn-finger nucleic acid-binding protein